MISLKELVARVRNCKTASEERAIVAKESAEIRTCIRVGGTKANYKTNRHGNPHNYSRCVIVSKLLFLHILGYPTHFGQFECIRLVASSTTLQEKRMGYLGLLILVGDSSSSSDLLLLVTNSLKNDLQSTNMAVVGLALCAIGNLATVDMARDLAPDIMKHIIVIRKANDDSIENGIMVSSSPYNIRKKALLAMARCISKVPDLVEYFANNDSIVTLLNDANHGVVLAALHMINSTLLLDSTRGQTYEEMNCFDTRSIFVSAIPMLVKLLRSSLLLLTSVGNNPYNNLDYVAVPFVQVQILTALRSLLVGEGTVNTETANAIQDVLDELLMTTADCGMYAVLYECIVTIIGIRQCGDKLKRSAINILGQFLLNGDNNIRYVGLDIMSSSEVVIDTSLLQQHRDTILSCLKDPDISIRRRALDLSYRLVDHTCVDSITLELLSTLTTWSSDHRGEICTKLLSIINQYPSYDDCWKIDTLLSMLSVAGRECSEDIQWDMIGHISRASEDLKCYTVHKLVKMLRNNDDHSNIGLHNVAVWCIGEYSELLLKSYSYNPPSSKGNLAEIFTYESEVDTPDRVTFLGLDPYTVLHTVETVINTPACTEHLHQKAIASFAKMYNRFKDIPDTGRTRERIYQLMKRYETSHSLELQVRSCEFRSLISLDSSFTRSISPEVNWELALHGEPLQRMPFIKRCSDTSPSKHVLQPKDFFNTNSDSYLRYQHEENIKEPDLLDLNFENTSQIDVFLLPVETVNGPVENGYSNVTSFQSTPAFCYEDHAATPNYIEPNTTRQILSVADQSASEAFLLDMSEEISNLTNECPNNMMHNNNEVRLLKNNNQQQNHPMTVVKAISSENGLNVYFECTKPSPILEPKRSDLMTKFENMNDAPIHNLTMQVAVPSFVTIQIFPPSSTFLPGSSRSTEGTDKQVVTQNLSVVNTMVGIKKLKLKLKVTYNFNGRSKELLATVSSFPEGF